MPPFLPVLSISRSQSVRLGRGPGNQVVPELNSGDTLTNPATGALIGPFYADLGNSFVRKDYQHHQAFGAMVDTGAISNTVYSDLFAVSGFAVTAGSGQTLNVAAGIIQSRYSGAQISVAATTVQVPTAPAFGNQNSLVVVNNAGVVSLIPGAQDLATPTYDAYSLTSSAALTGTYKLALTFNGFTFTTAAVNVTSVGTAIATAVLAATGGPANAALSAFVPGGTVTGAGTAMSAGATTDTLTFGGALEGAVNMQLLSNAVSGGTLTFAKTASAVGGVQGPGPNGSYLILASINMASGAANAAAGTLSGTSLTLSS